MTCEWELIETTPPPKDGTAILVSRGEEVFIVRWSGEANGWSLDLEGSDYGLVLREGANPFYWMPLPRPAQIGWAP